ncbi:MAG: hypothetical protein AAF756_02980 [Pseudomonadota bacterium]
MLVLSQVFSSLGIGFLVGLLVGLSATPMVGLVVGAITALLASFLGLTTKDNPATPSETDAQKQRLILTGIRSGTFAVACAVGVLAGMYIRTHDSLSPSLLERKQELLGLGFTEDEARLMVTQTPTGSEASEPSYQASVLFASDDIATCDQVDPDRFGRFSTLLETYRELDVQPFTRIAERINENVVDDAQSLAAMIAVTSALCAELDPQ